MAQPQTALNGMTLSNPTAKPEIRSGAGLTFRRHFTDSRVSPFDAVEWERRTARRFRCELLEGRIRKRIWLVACRSQQGDGRKRRFIGEGLVVSRDTLRPHGVPQIPAQGRHQVQQPMPGDGLESGLRVRAMRCCDSGHARRRIIGLDAGGILRLRYGNRSEEQQSEERR